MEGALALGGFILFLVVVVPFLSKLQSKQLRVALDFYNEENGTILTLEKVSIPPLRLWLQNRKGDVWGRVVHEDGSKQWVRLRRSIFSSSSPLTFFDV